MVGGVNVTIDELMQQPVMTATPHQTVGHVRKVMSEHKVSAMPVVDSDGQPVGIVTATDLLDDHKDATPISEIMASPVYTVPRYDGPHIAARVMRNHHLHHVVVTEEIVGMISSFDLLQLVEDHRFVAKQGPTPSKKRKGRQ